MSAIGPPRTRFCCPSLRTSATVDRIGAGKAPRTLRAVATLVAVGLAAVRLLVAPLVVALLVLSSCAGTGMSDQELGSAGSDAQVSSPPDDAVGTPPASTGDDEPQSALSSAADAPGAASDDVVELAQAEPAGPASSEGSVWLADLTWTEVAEHLASGWTTIIIPTGGIEQNGPHLALNKHHVVVAYTAEQIATRAGNTLVAPVLDYVPEGDVATMSSHLQWAGTISVPEEVFAAVLESAARSFVGHGFTTIVFLGDSGSSQGAQATLADRLATEWSAQGIVVANMSQYYSANGQVEWLLSQGETQAAIGLHAGIRDTSEVLSIAPELVRPERAAASTAPSGQLDARGVDGDPTRATAAYGAELLERKIATGVAELTRYRNR